MKILALEFSSPRRSVAVAVEGVTRGTAAEAGGRTTHAFAMIDSALAQAGWQREEIDCLAVGTGPGSYAGIRIAIAIAQGWQIARGVKLLGISSAEAVAARAGQSGRTNVHIGLDAQRMNSTWRTTMPPSSRPRDWWNLFDSGRLQRSRRS